jgi:hypothetical protein
VHVNEETPPDSLAATGARFQRQVRTDRVRPPGSKPTASTLHGLEAIPSDYSAGTESSFWPEVRSEVRPSSRRHTTKTAASKSRRNASRPNSANNIHETWGSSSGQAASRSGSMSSLQSDRGRTGFKGLFSRRSSTHTHAESGYEEIIFDSRSANSGSQASVISGRRGPLDEFAKSAMKAVKRVGACWRCKFLRKSVSSINQRAEKDAKSW